MKKIKNLFWVLSVFIFTLQSCSVDIDDEIRLLKKTVEISADGTETTTIFSYNQNEITRIESDKQRSDFTYADGQITKIIITDKVNKSTQTTDYSYEKGMLISARTNSTVVKYIHNTDNTVSYSNHALDSFNQEIKISHGILHFKNKNFIKDEGEFDKTEVGVKLNYAVSFEYDSKKNPLFNILGYDKLLDHYEEESVNNSLIRIESSSCAKNDQITSSAILCKSFFKYNQEGYPTEKISQADADRDEMKTQYFYE